MNIFWNPAERRLRAIWRFVAFLALAATLVNPAIILLGIDDQSALGQVAINVLVAASMFVALWVSARWIERRPMSAFGLEWNRRAGREILAGLLIGIIGVGAAVGFGVATKIFSIQWAGITSVAGVAFGWVVASQVLRYAAGSFFEELLSRGVMFRALAEGLNRRPEGSRAAVYAAWILTSVLFGLLHLANPGATWLGVMNLSLLGALFGLPMVYTGRLWLSMGLHAAWNLAQNVLFGMPNSGKPSIVSLWEVQSIASNTIAGGGFGLEGGLMGTLALLLCAALIWGWLRRTDSRPDLQLDLSVGPASPSPRQVAV